MLHNWINCIVNIRVVNEKLKYRTQFYKAVHLFVQPYKSGKNAWASNYMNIKKINQKVFKYHVMCGNATHIRNYQETKKMAVFLWFIRLFFRLFIYTAYEFTFGSQLLFDATFAFCDYSIKINKFKQFECRNHVTGVTILQITKLNG